MSGLDSILSIASSGLAATNAQLALVSHNIANAGTTGYVTESLSQSTRTAAGEGQGVTTGLATRQIDLQLQQDVLTQNATVSALSTTQSVLQPIDAAQGTVAGGNDLTSLLANLQGAFTTLSNDPSNAVQQSAVVGSADTLAGQINTLSNAYGSARQSAQDSLVGAVAQLNTALGQIGALSDQIMQLRNQNQSTADLESQRDQAISTVSSLVSAKFLQQPDGDVVALTTGGLTLPVHATGPGPFILSQASIGANSSRAAGTVPGITLDGTDVTANLTGGSIGALVQLRDATLPTYQAELDQFSQTLSSRFADQGLALFTDPSGNVPAASGTPVQSSYVGYAGAIGVNPAVSANPGLVRDGTASIAGSPTGASAFTANPAGGPASFATLVQRVLTYSFGTQAQSGVPQPGVPSTGLGSDGTLASPYATTGSLADTASSLVTAQSDDVATATAALTNEQAVQTTLTAKQSAEDTVNTDTELATMVQLQSSYGANAKIFTAVQAMWSALLASVT